MTRKKKYGKIYIHYVLLHLKEYLLYLIAQTITKQKNCGLMKKIPPSGTLTTMFGMFQIFVSISIQSKTRLIFKVFRILIKKVLVAHLLTGVEIYLCLGSMFF